MAGAFVTLRISDREWHDARRGVDALISDPHLMLLDMGEELLQSTRDRLVRGVSPDGQPFQPLSPAYQAIKPKNKGRVLIREGDLVDQLGYQVEDDALRVGTPKVYGATHQFGDDERGIPQREFLGISDTDVLELEDIARRYLGRAIKR